MERFEIEDIVAQDSHGVVFRARIRSSGAPVAIRRFFPFGKEGEGLEKEEGIAFGIAASRLASLNHPALRSVIEGSVDPIDGMPYLVSEWIEGETLPNTLNGEKLEPALVIDIMRLALEVSLVLSKVLGEEALWVETDPDSILVGDSESGRGFTFWLSPFKWLGADADQRNLSGLVTLGEKLAGWNNRLVSDQAGNGLGGWFKWLKANPETDIRQAMEALAACTGEEPPPPDEVLVRKAISKPTVLIQQPSTKAPLLIAGALAMLVVIIGLVYMNRTKELPVVPDEIAQQKISAVIVTEEEQPKEKEVPATHPAAAATPNTRPEILRLHADQMPIMRKQKKGTPIELTGKVINVELDRTKTIMTISLEGISGVSPMHVVINQKGYQGKFDQVFIKKYIGKLIIAKGTVLQDRNNISRNVLVKSNHDITLKEPAETQNTPKDPQPSGEMETPEETVKGEKPLSPDDREIIEELENGTQVSLSGLFRSTRFSSTGKSLYLEFASRERDSVRGVIHQSDYPGDYSSEAFTELIGKQVTITGTVFIDNFKNPALVKIRSRDDIEEKP